MEKSTFPGRKIFAFRFFYTCNYDSKNVPLVAFSQKCNYFGNKNQSHEASRDKDCSKFDVTNLKKTSLNIQSWKYLMFEQSNFDDN